MALAKVHSNASVRNILEKEIKRHINVNRDIVKRNIEDQKTEVRRFPVIENSGRDAMLGKHKTTQNLPYIYRNPAI